MGVSIWRTLIVRRVWISTQLLCGIYRKSQNYQNWPRIYSPPIKLDQRCINWNIINQ